MAENRWGGRPMRRLRLLGASTLVALALMSTALMATGRPTSAGPRAPGDAAILDRVDLQRPRLLLRRADLPGVVARLGREPYRTLFGRVVERGAAADGVALDDHSIGA